MLRLTLALQLAVFALAALTAAAAALVGPTPGILASGAGIDAPGGGVRYVVTNASGKTIVKAVRARDGRVLRRTSLAGRYGIPLVTYNGDAGGLSRDGRQLVLSTEGTKGPSTRFVVLRTKPLRVSKSLTFKGIWSFDALSPDARTLYLIEHVSLEDVLHYRVRAYDLDTNRLSRAAIVDKSDPEPMSGLPISRVSSSGGTWVYTLYLRPESAPFVHALNAANRFARCLDFTWPGTENELGTARLTLSEDEKKLVIRGGGRLMTLNAPT